MVFKRNTMVLALEYFCCIAWTEGRHPIYIRNSTRSGLRKADEAAVIFIVHTHRHDSSGCSRSGKALTKPVLSWRA